MNPAPFMHCLLIYSIVNRPTVNRKKILPDATASDRNTTSTVVVGIARVNLVPTPHQRTATATDCRRTVSATCPRHEDPLRKTASAAGPPRLANRRHGSLELHRRPKSTDNRASNYRRDKAFILTRSLSTDTNYFLVT